MGAKRILYITNQNLTLYLCHKHGPSPIDRCDISPDSLQRFNAQLSVMPDIPNYVLADLIEEDYRNEAIPHVLGQDRKTLTERKLGQLFRGTPYRTALFQGRQQQGRRDDKVLFTSLSNPDGLNYWLDKIKANKAPLAGIYSLPLLSQMLLQKLKIKTPNTLLLSQQSNDMLRQTFFNDYHLKNSRLSHLSGADPSTDLDYFLDVVQKNQRYLHRLRLLPLGTTLNVYFLAPHNTVTHNPNALPNTDELSFHTINISDAATAIGFKQYPAGLQSEQLFVWLLSRATPPANYAAQAERRYFFMHQARRYTYRASIAATVASLTWSGFNLFNGYELRDKTARIQLESQQLDQRRIDAIAALPQTPLPPTDLQNAVETSDRLNTQKSNPELMMIALSRALAVHPNLQLDEIEWQTATASSDEEDSGDLTNGAVPEDDTTARYQEAILKGHIEPYQEDFHTAFALVTGFIKSLQRDRAFVLVEPVAMPLNTDPSSMLNGDVASSTIKTRQRFEIRTLLKVNGDAV